MQAINTILGSELNIDAELTEAQMELLCGGADEEAEVVEENVDGEKNSECDYRDSYEIIDHTDNFSPRMA